MVLSRLEFAPLISYNKEVSKGVYMSYLLKIYRRHYAAICFTAGTIVVVDLFFFIPFILHLIEDGRPSDGEFILMLFLSLVLIVSVIALIAAASQYAKGNNTPLLKALNDSGELEQLDYEVRYPLHTSKNLLISQHYLINPTSFNGLNQALMRTDDIGWAYVQRKSWPGYEAYCLICTIKDLPHSEAIRFLLTESEANIAISQLKEEKNLVCGFNHAWIDIWNQTRNRDDFYASLNKRQGS